MRRLCSTFSLHNDIMRATDSKQTDVLFNLSASFNNVDHHLVSEWIYQTLLVSVACLIHYKLELSGHRLKIRITGVSSSSCPLDCGVPQGSIFAPQLNLRAICMRYHAQTWTRLCG